MDTNRYRAANEVLKALRLKSDQQEGRSGLVSIQNRHTFREHPTHQAHTREAFDRAWDALGREQVQNNIYTSKDTRERLSLNYETADPDEFYERWRKVANLFSYEHKVRGVNIRDLVKKIGERQGNTIIIDLSENNVPPDTYWNDSIRFILIGEFRRSKAGGERHRAKQLLSRLVVIDEATALQHWKIL